MTTHTLILTTEHLAVIDKALQEMPLRLAYPVVVEINRQLAAAAQAALEAPQED